MNRRKPEQIVQLLYKVDGELATEETIEEICRDEQISPATYYRWKQKHGGLSIQYARRLKALEVENTKRLVAMRKAAEANPRYGYRRIAVVSGLGFGTAWRLWKQHDFHLAAQRSRRRRKKGTQPSRLLQAELRLANMEKSRASSVLIYWVCRPYSQLLEYACQKIGTW